MLTISALIIYLVVIKHVLTGWKSAKTSIKSCFCYSYTFSKCVLFLKNVALSVALSVAVNSKKLIFEQN